jgi:hypothetical protein
VAQSGSASGLGPEGRRFESSRSDHFLQVDFLNVEARIYKPHKSAMQAGRANTKAWVLEFVNPQARRRLDPLMGWTSIDDTSGQVRLFFDTREQAIAYAEREGLNFTVDEARERSRLVKSYSENFSARRKQPWTH